MTKDRTGPAAPAPGKADPPTGIPADSPLRGAGSAGSAEPLELGRPLLLPRCLQLGRKVADLR